jgi:hypothetical protein
MSGTSAMRRDAFAELERQVPEMRCIVVVGLPGTGKSFVVRRVARLAAGGARRVHVLQWDVARLAWDTPEILARFPEVNGITHAAIRGALGMWVRAAAARWFESCAAHGDLLIVEAPVIGGRFSELAKRLEDALEPHLAHPRTLFVVVAPTLEVQQELRRRRAAESGGGAHAFERHNASVGVLDVQLAAVEHVARLWGNPPKIPGVYDPELYVETMRAVLKHRHVLVAQPDSLLTALGSVYDLGAGIVRVAATAEEVAATIAAAERDLARLRKEVEFGWAFV